MSDHILVIDEGTTSTRAMLFGIDGDCLGSCQKPITQHYPAPGLVEHDAAEIWTLTLACAQEMVKKAGGAHRIAGIGITNQRETIVFWDRRTGEPLAPAIVWQDRRTAEICETLLEACWLERPTTVLKSRASVATSNGVPTWNPTISTRSESANVPCSQKAFARNS